MRKSLQIALGSFAFACVPFAAASLLPSAPLGLESILLNGFEDNGTRGWSATVPPTCTDGSVSGNETGVDCGGPDCPACPPGDACDTASDCDSGVCVDGTCAPPACNDGVPNGDETDVDCGGPVCRSCASGQACALATDCESGICFNLICVDCVSADDCPLTGNECLARTCTSNTCGTVPEPGGSPVSTQTPGDCQLVVCDGFGATTSIPDDTDLPDDGNECTFDTCTGGVPMHFPQPDGFPCMAGTGTCQVGVCFPN